MKQFRVSLFLLLISQLSFSCAFISSENSASHFRSEKLFIVERERESVAVIGVDAKISHIADLGNLNHATLKFKKGFGYVLARDGYLAKIDTLSEKLVKKVKIGKSGIGITFTENQVVIVNYDPNSVVILDLELNVQKVIETNSRNVGIKVWKNYLVFSLMDKNEIWVLDSLQEFKMIKKFENIGNLPFDALIHENVYVVGFFNEPSVGLLDLNLMTYTKIAMKDAGEQLIYKVPHFGQWGVVDQQVFVPMVSSNKLLVLDLKSLKAVGEVQLIGRAVFAAVSPDKKILAVNFSGDQEDYISLVDTSTKKVMSTFKAGKRIMHLRFSRDARSLYATSYFENKLYVFDAKTTKEKATIPVSTPSGIFIEEEK
jgi:protein NirF